mmetsp:Transcript_21293/g.47022  ORF Transcript_21293/g.47022 Transcript_21293/m.47022 type:complete len:241 (-) Transcript_21293:44-766(-)
MFAPSFSLSSAIFSRSSSARVRSLCLAAASTASCLLSCLLSCSWRPCSMLLRPLRKSSLTFWTRRFRVESPSWSKLTALSNASRRAACVPVSLRTASASSTHSRRRCSRPSVRCEAWASATRRWHSASRRYSISRQVSLRKAANSSHGVRSFTSDRAAASVFSLAGVDVDPRAACVGSEELAGGGVTGRGVPRQPSRCAEPKLGLPVPRSPRARPSARPSALARPPWLRLRTPQPAAMRA